MFFLYPKYVFPELKGLNTQTFGFAISYRALNLFYGSAESSNGSPIFQAERESRGLAVKDSGKKLVYHPTE